MLIIGHRGSSYDAPENTLSAFRLAWEEGADGVELDVMLSADGEVVVHHDETLKRTTGLDRPVSECSLREIKKLDAGGWKGARWHGECVPVLSEMLAEVPRGRLVFIEIKCGKEILAPLKKVIHEGAFQPAQIIFLGFSLPLMMEVKHILPAFRVLLNMDTSRFSEGDAQAVPRKLMDAGLDGVGLGYDKDLTANIVEHCISNGLETAVWTIDKVGPAHEMENAGAQYLITNRPGWMRRELLGIGEHASQEVRGKRQGES